MFWGQKSEICVGRVFTVVKRLKSRAAFSPERHIIACPPRVLWSTAALLCLSLHLYLPADRFIGFTGCPTPDADWPKLVPPFQRDDSGPRGPVSASIVFRSCLICT